MNGPEPYWFVVLAWLAGGAPLLAALSGRLTLTTGLWTFVMCAATGLG